MSVEPQRILMTADTVGGVWTYALDLARSLASHDIEVALATMGAPLSPRQRDQVRGMSNVQVYESRYKLEWMDDPWTDVARAGDWLLTLENELSPDIVHLNGYCHGSLPWREPHIVVGHSCVLSWWQAVKGEPVPGSSWAAYRERVTLGLRSADVVVAPTRAMLAELARYYGPFVDTAVIPNGRNAAAYRVAAKQRFVLAAGRLWDEGKNISALDAIAGRLPWPVFIAGDPRHPNGSEVRPANLRVLGSLDEAGLAERMAGAAIYSLPARYEPFGLSILEAALSGCALVLGDIPSLRENWAGAAFLVPPEDPDALEWALTELIGSESRRRNMGEAARARAAAFTPERMCSAYLCLYRRMLNGTPVAEMVH